tara:strand:+ start:317 stop:742 length:426 start_codon:yes stop_codon:yes gene_type:complete
MVYKVFMYDKKHILANVKKEFLVLLIFLIFALKLNFFKNTYFTFVENYSQRLIKAYDFCEETGVGYIELLKQNYKFSKVPKIVSFHKLPDVYWLFNKNKYEDQKKIIVLFNNTANREIRFNFKNYKILDNFKNDCLLVEKK